MILCIIIFALLAITLIVKACKLNRAYKMGKIDAYTLNEEMAKINNEVKLLVALAGIVALIWVIIYINT